MLRRGGGIRYFIYCDIDNGALYDLICKHALLSLSREGKIKIAAAAEAVAATEKLPISGAAAYVRRII